MTQTTIRDLGDQLATAFGMAPRALAYVGDDLGRAGMIGQQDEPATVEDATRMLIAVAGDFDVRAPHRAVERFWGLPLARVQLITEGPGTLAWVTAPADDSHVAVIRETLGDTFGTAFTNLIGDFVFLPESPPAPGNISLSGSPGRTCASLRRDRAEGSIMLRFDVADFMGGIAPFGLPPASLLRTVEIPAAIFQVLRDALEGSPHSWANAAEGRVDVYSRRSLEGD